MTTLFIVLVVLASVILGLIVLVQNPKGGGLTGNIAGFSNQFMGVKQTTDVLERGTWIFISGSASSATDRTKEAAGATVPASSQPTVPANTVPAVPSTTPPVTTPK